jgi:hypothetical protein
MRQPLHMRQSVENFLSLGPVPDETASPEQIKRHQDALHAITPPVSLSEANALAGMFGPDDCFGLGWTLVHLIESAPNWASEGHIPPGTAPGLLRLRKGIENAKKG